MFGFLGKKHDVVLHAPMKGKVVPLEEVPDPVFSQKIIGDGFAIIPSSGLVCSPCKGRLMQIFPTNHAIMIKSSMGIELIIHLGIDTVELKGKGFKRLVEPDRAIKVGQPLVEMDIKYIKDHGKPIITPVIITPFDQVENMEIMYKNCHVKDEVCKLSLKERFI